MDQYRLPVPQLILVTIVTIRMFPEIGIIPLDFKKLIDASAVNNQPMIVNGISP